jgi:hypothetical protein
MQNTAAATLAAGVAVAWDVQPAGLAAQQATGQALGAAVFESIGRTGVALKGPTGTPFGTPYRIEVGPHAMCPETTPRVYPSVAIALRKEFDLYMNLRPIRSFPTVPSSTASTSIVALSVSISQTTWPDLTVSPTLTCHLASLPSVMVGESAGIRMLMDMPSLPPQRLQTARAASTM